MFVRPVQVCLLEPLMNLRNQKRNAKIRSAIFEFSLNCSDYKTADEAENVASFNLEPLALCFCVIDQKANTGKHEDQNVNGDSDVAEMSQCHSDSEMSAKEILGECGFIKTEIAIEDLSTQP